MSRKEELTQKYADDLREKCDVEPDMDALKGVVDALGPSIYNRDSETVSSSDSGELETVKNFVMKKLGVDDEDAAMGAVQKALRTYGHDNRHKYRAVLHYLIAEDQGKLGQFR